MSLLSAKNLYSVASCEVVEYSVKYNVTMVITKRVQAMQGMDGNNKKSTYAHHYKAKEKANINIYYTLSTTYCLLKGSFYSP